MYRTLFTLLFALTSFTLFAQPRVDVSGQIFDAEFKRSMTGVNVVIKGEHIGTGSDDRGYFFISVKHELPFTLRFTMIGYLPEEVVIKNRLTSGLKIKLKSMSYKGEEIVISAPPTEVEQKTMTKIVSVEMLDALSIKETPAPDFFNALGNLKGVDVVQQSMQFITVNARGFNSTVNTRFVQLVDGMDNQAPGMNFSIGNIIGTNELDVESIEFLPGPSSVRYGGNVLNGLLQINTKDPFQFQGLSMYIKPGVSDIIPGNDAPFQFHGKWMTDVGVRFAKSLNDKFAFKINASYMKGKDWFADDTSNIRPGSIHYEYDPGHDAINKYGDEVTALLPVGENRENIIVSRTGYRDKNLVDNGVFSLKLGGSLHYRLNDRTTMIIQGNYGNATTVFTEENRTSLSDFKIYQGKVELNSKRISLRAYSTKQQTGKTYDANYLAVHLNNAWKSNEEWFRDYENAYTGRLAKYGVYPGDHRVARDYADYDRLNPGTKEFEKEKNRIINESDFNIGAQTINNSYLSHVEGSYRLIELEEIIDIEIGANYRFFDLESFGTIFPDSGSNDITFFEYGSYIQLKKSLLGDALKISLSARYDKSENFEGHITPRISALYSYNKAHHFRASLLTGYRNPSAKEQFIKKDLGQSWLIGGLQNNLSPLELPDNSIYGKGILEFNQMVAEKSESLSNPMAPEQAVLASLYILEDNTLDKNDLSPLLPEQVLSFEFGYKTKFLDKIFIDLVYYHSNYENFIGMVDIVKPRTSPTTDLYSASKQINTSSQSESYLIYTNSKKNISIQGVAAGLKYIAPVGIIFSGNMTWSDISKEINDPLIPGFNTPEYKFNASIANRRLDKMDNNPGFENIGYNLIWRWQSGFYWESPFGNGWMDPLGSWDVQVSYRFHQPESILKFGISNLFNDEPNTTYFGGPQIGSFFYVSYLVENLFNRSK